MESDGNFDLFLMASDGTGLRRLTTDPARDFAGRFPWAPDGSRFVFSSNRSGPRTNFEIFVGFLDGRPPIRLTENAARDEYPSWSSPHVGNPTSTRAPSWVTVKEAFR